MTGGKNWPLLSSGTASALQGKHQTEPQKIAFRQSEEEV
jgi:hypothetical protein